MSFSGQKVAVIGLAINNTPLIRYLVKEGAKVTVLDQKTPDRLGRYLKQISDLPLEYRLGPDYLTDLDKQDLVFLSPGIPKSLPAIREAKKKGVRFSSELQLFFSLNQAPVIGVTGSNGKTTTTSLIGEMLTRVRPTKVGGNIGRPPLSFLSDLTEDTWIVLELSSFQLQNLGFSPHIAIVTNVTPNHLDIHSSMEEYIEAKKEILNHQKPNDIAMLNWDNDITREMAADVRGKTYFFSRRPSFQEVRNQFDGAYVKGDKLYLSINHARTEEYLCERGDLLLLGEHNVENILAAALAARLAGVPREIIASVVKEFKGVEHRLELIRELSGVRYFNDSISTTPSRAIAGLSAITSPIVLIAGGYDKNLPFDDFAKVAVERCRGIILFGATAGKIEEALNKVKNSSGENTRAQKNKFPLIERVSELDEAVETARKMALTGDVVLLSPACASYDMFQNFEERGRLFKKSVSELEP